MTAAMLDYTTSPKRNIKRIHVNQHLIRKGDPKPLTVKETKKNTPASKIEILDDDGNVVATFFYLPEHPLSCGAKVWCETRNELRIS